jgi:hypothetical protein
MAWMHMQIATGLKRLGHDVYYFETSSEWPFDPTRDEKVCDSDYALPYLARICESFGFKEAWAYRRSYLDGEWFGPVATRAERVLLEADAVFNVAGATWLGGDGMHVGPLVYFGTDPLHDEVKYSAGDAEVLDFLAEHCAAVTYGENIGTDRCPVPPLPGLRARTRQPILVDLWQDGAPTRPEYTTVSNWKQEGRDVEFDGRHYRWSKDVEFARFMELPSLVAMPLELATNLAGPPRPGVREGESVRAFAVEPASLEKMRSHGWNVVDARAFTADPWPYRGYVQSSRGEFTVARDVHVRLRSGWFSERSACYLAAGRPVIAQDTGFGDVLPTGEGLFAFATMDEAVVAFEAIESDYDRHSRAASEIAHEYFRAETVLAKLLDDLGL